MLAMAAGVPALTPHALPLQPVYTEEAQQVATVLVQANTVQQSLVVIVLQDAVSQVKGESVVDLLDLELVVGRRRLWCSSMLYSSSPDRTRAHGPSWSPTLP